MPAESIPRCPFGSNGDLGSSRLEEQLDGKITPSDAHSKEALYGPGRGTRGTPRVTRGRVGWLVLSPWGTFTSYSLPAFLAHSALGHLRPSHRTPPTS